MHERVLHCQPYIGGLLQVRLLFILLSPVALMWKTPSQAWLYPSKPEVAAEKGQNTRTKHYQGKIFRFIFHPCPRKSCIKLLTEDRKPLWRTITPLSLLGSKEVTLSPDTRVLKRLQICRVLGGTARPTAARTSATLHQPPNPPLLCPCQEWLPRRTPTRMGSSAPLS